jgi:anti-anti-sigma factor
MSVIRSWQKSRTAEFTTRPGRSATVITAHGELDAANADELTKYVERCVRKSRWVIVDLRDLEFIGTAGFSALHRINLVCSAAGARWTLLPGRVVSRLLRVCDPDGTLPTTTSLPEALIDPTAEREAAPRRLGLLQLVPEAR